MLCLALQPISVNISHQNIITFKIYFSKTDPLNDLSNPYATWRVTSPRPYEEHHPWCSLPFQKTMQHKPFA